MTALAEDLDLSWVTFAADDRGTPCVWKVAPDQRCGRESVAMSVWDQPCACSPAEAPVCMGHRDHILAQDAECPEWECVECRAQVRLLRMEPLR